MRDRSRGYLDSVLSKVLGQHVPPEQLQGSLAWSTILPKDILSFGIDDGGREHFFTSARLRSGDCERTLFTFILFKPFSDASRPIDGGTVILEETTPITIEMLYKAITQNNFVLICSDPSLRGDKLTQIIPAKCLHSITEPSRPLTVIVERSGLYCFLGVRYMHSFNRSHVHCPPRSVDFFFFLMIISHFVIISYVYVNKSWIV